MPPRFVEVVDVASEATSKVATFFTNVSELFRHLPFVSSLPKYLECPNLNFNLGLNLLNLLNLNLNATTTNDGNTTIEQLRAALFQNDTEIGSWRLLATTLSDSTVSTPTPSRLLIVSSMFLVLFRELYIWIRVRKMTALFSARTPGLLLRKSQPK